MAITLINTSKADTSKANTSKGPGSRIPAMLSGLLAAFLLCTGMLAHAGDSPFRDLVDTNGKSAASATTVGNGKWTLVMIWATDCHICTEQKPEISAFYDKHKDIDVDVFGIALDCAKRLDAVNAYLAEHKPTFPNYVGDFQMVGLNYQSLTEEPLRGTPTYLLFNPQGELKGNNPGPVRPEAIESFIESNS